MKMAPFTEFIVHLNISLLLGVIDSLTNQRCAGDVIASIRESSLLLGKNKKIMMMRTCTKSHHLRADEDDDVLDKIPNRYLRFCPLGFIPRTMTMMVMMKTWEMNAFQQDDDDDDDDDDHDHDDDAYDDEDLGDECISPG